MRNLSQTSKKRNLESDDESIEDNDDDDDDFSPYKRNFKSKKRN